MLKICFSQIEVEPGHPDLNFSKMLQAINEAKANNADIIIFPEMVIPGYLLGDTWEQTSYLKDCLSYGEDIIAQSNDICIIFGNIAVDWQKKNTDGRVRKYNALYAAYQGKLIQPEKSPYPFAIKTLFPNYREFDDSRYFYSLQSLADELDTSVDDLLSPMKVNIKGQELNLGCILCEDGWSDDYNFSPIDILCKNYKLDMLINISASPYTFGKNNKRHRVFSKQAKDNQVPLIYVNNIGIQNNGKTIYTFDGSSTVYDKNGNIIACCPAYSGKNNYINLNSNEDYTPLPIPQNDDISNIYQALSYGIKKFLKDIHMKKVVIGISGGIDSAVASALYVNIIGKDNVTLINMPSKFNSETTKGLSSQLAHNLGCQYAIVPIQEVVDFTVNQFEHTDVVDLTTQNVNHLTISSFVKENIQARDRSARILAGMSAAIGGGFTCNANKAETTVGYSTLYGDQSGFLAALADLWKHQVYDLARYLNKEVYKREVIPQGIIDIIPSAELSAEQDVDAGKGDPIKYPYHDYLFRSFVESWQKVTPEDILTWYSENTLEEHIGCEKGLVAKYFSTAKEFIADLERWWNLFTGMAIAKRIQAPPILAISRRAYGFDHRESQNGAYYTRAYKQLKAKLLGETA
ncbi:Glutamine-dependent NAD(+) synthetase [Megamonas hypermegale]|uniref:Glutamine-dependent NAD(+) synthetase n=1 Tax=Megamonas hypermegale TaxID=158847 RepID=A0A239TDD0_9FIRM|nr:NAD(+) synthase [Megamonas hypermegale]SNU95178.1 Glutamine-dependent NAD(+) synthetase [Megamonas hypermegale]